MRRGAPPNSNKEKFPAEKRRRREGRALKTIEIRFAGIEELQPTKNTKNAKKPHAEPQGISDRIHGIVRIGFGGRRSAAP